MILKAIYALFFFVSILNTDLAFSQTENLPRGVGIYGLGYRYYEPQTEKFNNQGELELLGNPFTKEFDGKNLLDGAGGAELKELATELKKFDGNSDAKDSLLNSLELGKLEADVVGNIDVEAFVLGFGITEHLSLLLQVPWVNASVDTDISFSGVNNAQLIKDRLGDLAFEKLQDGLDQASEINKQQILDSIENLGYASIDHWEYSGIGDISIGTSLAYETPISDKFRTIQGLRTTLNIPTGYYEDPDILTDISIGKGYYLLTNRYVQKFVIRDFWVGGDVLYGYGMPTKVSKRVPEGDESLVAAERTTDVELTPGDDFGYGGMVGYKPSWVQFLYYVGVRRHLRDSYDGDLEGNYNKLSQDTNSYKLFQEPSVQLDTVNFFKQKRFPVPLLLRLKAHLPIQGKNSLNDRYYELGMSSFFSTPLASTTTAESKKRSHKLRKMDRERKEKRSKKRFATKGSKRKFFVKKRSDRQGPRTKFSSTKRRSRAKSTSPLKFVKDQD